MTQVTITGDYNGFLYNRYAVRRSIYVVTDVHDTHHDNYIHVCWSL